MNLRLICAYLHHFTILKPKVIMRQRNTRPSVTMSKHMGIVQRPVIVQQEFTHYALLVMAELESGALVRDNVDS